MAKVEVRRVAGGEDVVRIQELMMAYGRFLQADTTGAVDVCLAGYEREVNALPGAYSGADGVLLLALADGRPAGCVGVRRLKSAGTEHGLEAAEALKGVSCEMKRLWVGPEFRGLGIGRKLAEGAVQWARTAGYEWMFLDTVPAAMSEAYGMYRAMGFEELAAGEGWRVEHVREEEQPGATGVRFFRLGLQTTSI